MEFRGWRSAVLASLAAIALAAPAGAQAAAGATDYARSGWYVGIGGHAAFEQIDGGDFGDSGGIDAVAGYRLSPNVALEGHFDWNSDFSDPGYFTGTCNTRPGPVTCQGALTIDVLSLTANAKLLLPFRRVQPFVLIGGGLMRGAVGAFQSQSDGETNAGYVARLGGGVDLYATRKLLLSLGVSYLLPTGAVEDLQYLSVGGNLQFRF